MDFDKDLQRRKEEIILFRRKENRRLRESTLTKYEKTLDRKIRIAEKKKRIREKKLDLFRLKNPAFSGIWDKVSGRKKINVDTFTKRWVARLLWFSSFWITASYLLAFTGRESIADSLSQTVCSTIVGTMVPYFIKSFFETFCEMRNKLKDTQKNENPVWEEPEAFDNMEYSE